MDVAARIAGAAQHLRREIVPTLTKHLGVTFPFVLVKRVCWLHKLGDGTGGMVKARMGPLGLPDGTGIWAIQVSAVALLEYSDDLMAGLLAHEFLHYVWFTLESAEQVGEDLDLADDSFERG